jgi:hypothetical protein
MPLGICNSYMLIVCVVCVCLPGCWLLAGCGWLAAAAAALAGPASSALLALRGGAERALSSSPGIPGAGTALKPSSLPVSSGARFRANAELRQPRHHHLRHRSAPATSCLAQQARVCPVAAGPRPGTHRTMAAPAAAGAEGVIRAEKRGRVVVWTMNNPQKLNCLNIAMITRMGQLFEEASVDPTVDAAILTGTGRYFSSGAAFGDVGLPKTLRLSTLHAAVASLNGECTQASISVCCSCTCRCTCRLRQSTVWGR